MRPRTGAGLGRLAARLGLTPALAAGVAFWVGFGVLSGRGASGAEPLAREVSAKAAVAPAATVLPAEVVAAMQEGKYAEADALLARLEAKPEKAADRAYYAWIRAIAQRLDRRPDAARATLRAALDAAPKGPWAAKIRLELAGVELAAGRPSEAEALARTEAESLLAGDRRDRLAEVYHAFARRLLKPDDPVTPPDPNAAYDLLTQAYSLAKGEALRAR